MFNEIISEIADDNKSLINPLFKTKILASRLGNEELLNWVNTELDGYADDDALPSYRILKTTTSCTISNLFGHPLEVNVPVPISLISGRSDFRDSLTKFEFTDGIKVIENFAADTANDMIGRELPADAAAFLSHKIIEGGNKFRISNVKILVHKSVVLQIISSIRSKLLDLILKIEQLYPDLNLGSAPTDSEKVAINKTIQIIMSQVNVTGNDNNVNAGNNNNLQKAEGKNINLTIGADAPALEKLDELTKIILSSLDKWGLDKDDENDVRAEVERLKNQLARSEPKKTIIFQSLDIIQNIALSIAANAWTEPVLSYIDHIFRALGQQL